MYDVLVDGELLYSPRLASENYVILEPQATVELNKAGSFTFQVPACNPKYKRLTKMKSIVTLRDNGRVIWKGRVLTDDKDFYNTKNVTCEGELAFLNDILYKPHDYSKQGIAMGEYFKMLVNYYTANCDPERKLQLGNVTGAWTSIKIYPKTTEYTNIWTLISGNLIGASVGKDRKTEVELSQYDRYLCVRRVDGVSYIDYEEKLNYQSGQVIEFGKNLLDLSEYIDASNVYTYIIPLGKADSKGNRVDISFVNGGKSYLKSEVGEMLFGKIEKAVIWEDETNRFTLKSNGQKKLEKAVEMAVKITIRAFDLHLIDVDSDYLQLGDQVHVVSRPHNISSDFLCSKIVYRPDQPENAEYSFGLNFESMSDNLSKWKITQDFQIRGAFEQAEDAGKTATDYIRPDGDGTFYGPDGSDNGILVRPDGTTGGLEFDGIRNLSPLWTNASPDSGMGNGTTILQGALSSYNAVAIGFREYYTNGWDSGEATPTDLQFTVLPLNGETALCTRAWDIFRIRKVTASKSGITFGASGYYETKYVFGVPHTNFVSNDTCCVPYVVYGFL